MQRTESFDLGHGRLVSTLDLSNLAHLPSNQLELPRHGETYKRGGLVVLLGRFLEASLGGTDTTVTLVDELEDVALVFGLKVIEFGESVLEVRRVGRRGRDDAGLLVFVLEAFRMGVRTGAEIHFGVCEEVVRASSADEIAADLPARQAPAYVEMARVPWGR